MEYDVAVAQLRWLSLSPDARQMFVTGSTEYIQFDRPGRLIETIHDIHDRAAPGPLPR